MCVEHCKYHVELNMLKVAMNYIRNLKKGLHATLRCHCDCHVCCQIYESMDGSCDGSCSAQECFTKASHNCGRTMCVGNLT